MRYRLKDDGYGAFQWIVRGREKVGRVRKQSDGSFVGVIGGIEATGASWETALQHVVAKVEGVAVSELSHDLIAIKPVQERTKAILHWLRNNAAKFTNKKTGKVMACPVGPLVRSNSF
jgi:hypothetical protein